MKTLYQNAVVRCLAYETEEAPPLESCLACEADKGPPRPERFSIERWSQTAVEPIAIDRPEILSALARQALIAEAELTPKPGLVDRRGSGAHSDLSLALMRRSAFAIEPFIRQMAFQSMLEPPSAQLRATLAITGRAAENAMLRVTNGSNTHKGAIWTLGLLAAAAAGGFNSDPFSITRTAALIASFEDPHQSTSFTHGQIVTQKFGVTGARGEAVNGFSHITELGLPMLRARRNTNAPEPIARLDVLLNIMAHLDDTCLLYRGGKAALQAAKQGASAVIEAGGAGSSRGWELLYALDHQLLTLGVSPGGSADLLSGTLFLDAVEAHSWSAAPLARPYSESRQKSNSDPHGVQGASPTFRTPFSVTSAPLADEASRCLLNVQHR